MNYFEWEIDYLIKLIKQKKKTFEKLENEGEVNCINYFRVSRELKALEMIYKVMTEEEEHLKTMLR